MQNINLMHMHFTNITIIDFNHFSYELKAWKINELHRNFVILREVGWGPVEDLCLGMNFKHVNVST